VSGGTRANRVVVVDAAEGVGAAEGAAARVSALQSAGLAEASQVLRAGAVGFALVGSCAAGIHEWISDCASRANALVRARDVVALCRRMARVFNALIDVGAAGWASSKTVSTPSFKIIFSIQ